MHGLINRVLHRFVRHRYGTAVWLQIAKELRIDPPRFESLRSYPDHLPARLIRCLARISGNSQHALLRDIGTFVVSEHNESERWVRLLEFGGANYAEFLLSLPSLRERLELVLPELKLPRLQVERVADRRIAVTCVSSAPGAGTLIAGALQGMARRYQQDCRIFRLSRNGGGDLFLVNLSPIWEGHISLSGPAPRSATCLVGKGMAA